MKTVYLKKDEDRRLAAGHLWIYSNEIDVARSPLSSFTVGECVKFESHIGKPVGMGYINPETLLCGRLLSRQADIVVDKNFFVERIKTAQAKRELIFTKPFYRLVFGESDGLPGLVIDRFGDIFVVQITTFGMENLKGFAVDALKDLFQPKGILYKQDTRNRGLEKLPLYMETAFGDVPSTATLEENGAKFEIPLLEGQKTGWFYDQHWNRTLCMPYMKGKRVLDVFSYIGGWGIEAAINGAEAVLCVDDSSKALNYLKKNAELNNVSSKVKTLESDAFEALKQLMSQKETFDVVVIDPPAFIKKQKDIPKGLEAYKKLQSLAIQCLKPLGLLISSSCSMHLEKEALLNVMRKAAIQQHRNLSIIHSLQQSPDHPIHPAIPETEYLKGFVAVVE